jgi:hypothetical protein
LNLVSSTKLTLLGIMFPPQEDGIIKFGAVNFVTNYHSSHQQVSLPRYRIDNLGDGVPEPIETHIRKWLKEIVPELADREWFETRICWYIHSLFPFSKATANTKSQGRGYARFQLPYWSTSISRRSQACRWWLSPWLQVHANPRQVYCRYDGR